MGDFQGNEWIASDRPFKDYPIGTKAKACGGGFWIKNEHGWKWCNGRGVFPRPGGDWTGEVCLPKTIFEQLPDGDLYDLHR